MQFSNTTSSADRDDPVLPSARETAAFVARVTPAAALGLLLALSLTSASATRMLVWPWATLSAVFWCVPVVAAAIRLALRRENARLGGLLDTAFVALALSGVAAAAFSPLRDAIAPHLLPFLGALALPYAVLPLVKSARVAGWSSAFLWPILLVAATRWALSFPAWTGPYPRNAEPFGHANITGSVCVLAAGWFSWLAASEPRGPRRLAHLAGAVLAAGLVLSSMGRGATLALAAGGATACAVLVLRGARPLRFALIAILATGALVLSNERLREAVFAGGWSKNAGESNAQRVAMIQGGFALGLERPLSGWGPGAVPHAFPRVRATLPGQPDNYLQLHNTPAQIAATLGLPGLIAAGMLGVGLALRLRKYPRPALAGLSVAGAVLLLFDHSFAVPAFAVLAALPVAALAPAVAPAKRTWCMAPIIAAGIALAIIAVPVARDLAARGEWDSALGAASLNDADTYAQHLENATRLAPADPFYSDQLAAHLATGHPFSDFEPKSPAAAAPALRAALAINPNLEAAHYNLGWLLVEIAPGEALEHLAAAARLAPARAGVYLGMARARLNLREAEAAVPALAAEVLLDPTFAWSPFWRDPSLGSLRARALLHAANFLTARGQAPDYVARLREPGEPFDIASVYRRVRTGQGVLFGHPDGPPPQDIPLLVRPAIPPSMAAELPPRGFVHPSLLLECAGLAP